MQLFAYTFHVTMVPIALRLQCADMVGIVPDQDKAKARTRSQRYQQSLLLTSPKRPLFSEELAAAGPHSCTHALGSDTLR